MRRTSIMTLGFVLILAGIQLNLVKSYELTPRFSNFLSENGGFVSAPAPAITPNNQQFNSPYYQASYPGVATNPSMPQLVPGQLKIINVPNWLCWPALFLGAVVFLHGFDKHE